MHRRESSPGSLSPVRGERELECEWEIEPTTIGLVSLVPGGCASLRSILRTADCPRARVTVHGEREIELECELEPGAISWSERHGGYRVGEFIYPSPEWTAREIGPEAKPKRKQRPKLPRTDTADG